MSIKDELDAVLALPIDTKTRLHDAHVAAFKFIARHGARLRAAVDDRYFREAAEFMLEARPDWLASIRAHANGLKIDAARASENKTQPICLAVRSTQGPEMNVSEMHEHLSRLVDRDNIPIAERRLMDYEAKKGK